MEALSKFFAVCEWMYAQSALGLKGCELILFAFIWSFFVHGKTMFRGEREIADDFGYSRRHVGQCLRSLIDKGFIVRSPKKHTGLPTYDYSINTDGVQKAYPYIKETFDRDTEGKVHTRMEDNVTQQCEIMFHNRNRGTDIYDTVGEVDAAANTDPPIKNIPTLEEIKQYATDTKSLTDPSEFYNTCCQRNWVIGGRQVDDWKRLFDKWKPKQSSKGDNANGNSRFINSNSKSVVDEYESLYKSIGYGND